jgi:hypothetical protein
MEQVLRGDGQSKLVFCGCGKLHFTYGFVTLHFDKDEFVRFADSVGRLRGLVKQAAEDSTLLPGHIQDASVCH